jgi:S-methylmethionine-dependent homocysteine/selenocysteine methylase
MKKSLDKPYGYVRSEYIKEEDWSLIYCMANTVASVEILNKPDIVFKLAEEYANAGINILHDKIYSTEYGSFEKNLEKE